MTHLRTVSKVAHAAILALTVALPAVMLSAHAAPVAQAVNGNMKVVLHDEPCALSHVVDLPYRATWTEGAQVFEGCYGVHPEFPIVVAYFSDKSIAVFPRQAFAMLTGV